MCQPEAAGPAGLCRLHGGTIRGDQAGALAQVGGIEHVGPAVAGCRHEVRICHILGTVGEGQARGFRIEMQPGWRWQPLLQRQLCGRRVIEDSEDLADGQRARAGWRHAADEVGLLLRQVPEAERLPLARLVMRQILQTELTGVAGVLLYLVDHGLCPGTLLQGTGTLAGKGSQ